MIETGSHSQQHARSLYRFHKKAVYGVFEYLFQAETDAARRTAHPAGDVDKKRMFFINDDSFVMELFLDPFSRCGVAQEERSGVLIVDEVAVRVRVREFSSFFHRFSVVSLVLFHHNAMTPEQFLFPLLRVGGHVDDHFISQHGADNADTQSQVAGGSHLNGITVQEAPHLFLAQLLVVLTLSRESVLSTQFLVALTLSEKSVVSGQFLCIIEDLVDAAPGFYGTGNGQMTILFQKEPPVKGCPVFLIEIVFHGVYFHQRRFDQPMQRFCLWKIFLDEGREPQQSLLCIFHVAGVKLAVFHALREGSLLWIHPEYFFPALHLLHQRLL